MSEGATTVGQIVAYLVMERGDWTRGVRDTERDAERIGRLNPNIRIGDNAIQVIGRLELVQRAADRAGAANGRLGQSNQRSAAAARESQRANIGLVESLALIAPAAVPISAVLGSALVGLLPTIATTALGISGISGELKSGALQGTAYGAAIDTAKTELGALKAIAAGGLLDGINRAVGQSGPLFKELNGDVAMMSGQLGDIVAGAAPALLSILTQLNPLFVTFGNLVSRGATELEGWASGTGSITKFVTYVEGALPDVMHLIGNLVVLASHVAQAAAPFGGVLLEGINLLVEGLDALPLGVLQALIPLVVSARVAFLGWRAVSGVIDSVGRSVTNLQGPFQARALAAQAAAAETASAAAAEAAAVTDASLVETRARQTAAEAALAAAEQQVAASVLVSEAAYAAATAQHETATVAVASAAEQTAAAEAAAAAATLAAEEQLAAATTARAAAAEASVGWSAALGPIGLVIGAVSILGLTMAHSASQTQVGSAAMNGYAESVKKSTDALNSANIAATNKNLTDAGAFALLDKLHSQNEALGVTYKDLALAVNGTSGQFDNVIARLPKAAGGLTGAGDATRLLTSALKDNRDALTAQILLQKEQQKAERESIARADGGSAAARAQAAALHLTGTAYLDAQSAAKKNAEQTAQQTAQFQLDADAAALLSAALDRLANKDLGVAESRTQLLQANKDLGQSFKDNGAAIRGSSDAALKNQAATQQQARAAQAVAKAVADRTKSEDAGIAVLRRARDAALAEAKAHGVLTPAVRRYINGLYDLKSVSDYVNKHPTKPDVDHRAALAKVHQLQHDIDLIRQNKVPGLKADSRAGKVAIADLQATIDAIRQGKVPGVHIQDDASAVLQQIQNYLDSLHDKTIQVRVTSPGGNTSFGGGRAPAVPATAKGSSGLADGWTTVGEGGTGARPELLYKSGSHVAIYSNADAPKVAAAHGLNAPGLAPMTVPTHASGTDVYRVGHGYGFQGSYYDSKRAADDARRTALGNAAAQRIFNTMQPADRSASQGGATAIASIITAQTPSVKAAMRKLGEIAAAAFQLKGIEKQLDAAKAKLTDMRDYRANVESTLSGQTDLTKAGSIGDLIAQLQGGTSQNNKYAGEVNKLRGEAHGNKTLLAFINQLAAQGDTTTLDTLAAGSKGDIANVVKNLGGYNSSLLAGGNAATTTKYGVSVDRQAQNVDHLIAEQRTMVGRVDRLVAALASLTKRPVHVEIDGHTVARAVIKDHAFAGVIDELSAALHAPRKRGH